MNMQLLTAIRKKGLRQWQVAEKAGITEPVLSRLLNERAMPDASAQSTMRKVARALGQSIERLFPGR